MSPAQLAPVPTQATPEKTGPVLVPRPGLEPDPALTMAILVGIALLPRLFLLPLNQNYYGDAVVRTELAERWLQHPHWISSMRDGAFQFGPFHLYLVGIALELIHAREVAGRLVSLFVGTLTVIPLYQLTRRLFDHRAAVVACLALSVWGMHLQFSTTAASEALGLFLALWTLSLFARGVQERRFGPLAGAAIVLNLACATRYDCWLLMPILCGLLLLGEKDRIAAVTRATLFGFLCLPFPLIWMQGNEIATGSAFAPMHYIDAFHQAWVGDGLGRYGQIGYRLHNLFFWPGAAVFTLTPLVAFFGIAGMVRAWRERPETRWLLWVAWLPTAYFTFRGAVLVNFAPLARFCAIQIALLLPFVLFGFEGVTRKMSGAARRGWAVAAAALAVAMPAWLGAYTFDDDGPIATSLRPVSPTSTNEVALMQVARFIKKEVAPKGGRLILDSDPSYRDLQIGFFGGLPEPRMARFRWEDFPKLMQSADPNYMVLIDGGGLEKSTDFHRDGTRVTFAGHGFREVPGFKPPYHVYEREP